LMYRILFEIVTKSCIAHGGLLASFLGKKVSTNLGAIQYHSGSCGDCEVKVCKVYDGRDM